MRIILARFPKLSAETNRTRRRSNIRCPVSATRDCLRFGNVTGLEGSYCDLRRSNRSRSDLKVADWPCPDGHLIGTGQRRCPVPGVERTLRRVPVSAPDSSKRSFRHRRRRPAASTAAMTSTDQLELAHPTHLGHTVGAAKRLLPRNESSANVSQMAGQFPSSQAPISAAVSRARSGLLPSESIGRIRWIGVPPSAVWSTLM